ncbi:sulfite exporter TauE/SafE family protein [Marinobacter sp. M216]|uniref:Probable membrane transporter protein n=1 Tax=Marinobacter albus TaxID=3030833 RepID=A0ABT7HEA0_9GAMM|nr:MULTISPECIES: sulfite exporter TauE/SafE family protein [unclassified Marinobacter]MBW7472114.1 sulfite exporter TauE/SafE family protein [Marinobacter sp. F4218]MDK9558684.1 sulfite exporter TauE/SafE family protein [Marinobacter sp. M216]
MNDISLFQILLANLALLAGACLQGVAGYGIGTLSAPLLFLVSPLFLPGPLILNATVLTVFMLVRNRGALQVRQVRFAIVGGAIGTVLAGLTLLVLSPKGFELIFGVLILAGVGLSIGGLRPALNARNSVMAGAASTYMGTITAVGGPPIALIYQNEKGPLVRANMSAFFLMASFLSLAALLFSGYLGLRELKLFGLTLPGVLVGFWLSGRLVNRMPFDGLRPVILAIAAVAGAAALVRGLLSL